MRRLVLSSIFCLAMTFFTFQCWAGEKGVVYFQSVGGVRVYLVEDHANPMVVVRILAPGGSVHDPEGKEGLATLTGWMFNEGAGDLNSEALHDRLDFFGISLSGDAQRDTQSVSMTTLTEHLDQAWELLGLALVRPRFDNRDFQRALRERLDDLKKGREQADWLAGRSLSPLMFDHHPYGRPSEGTEGSVKAIQVSDLKRFHQESFRAPDMVLAVAGDVTRERLEGLLARFMTGLDPTPSPFSPPPRAEPLTVGKSSHVELDISQTVIRMGVATFNREDPDYYPMLVMSQGLGGFGLTSRLTEEIREKRGLAYGVYCYYLPFTSTGGFMVETKTKTASVLETLQLIQSEMARMADHGMTAKELEDVKRYLIGSFPLNLDGLGKLAGTWSLIGYYRRGEDYLEQWPRRIQAVTLEDVQRVAKRVLDLKRFSTVTVGRGDAAKPHQE